VFGPKIKVPDELMQRLKECAETAGYSSVDEFVTHVLERAVAEIGQPQDDQGAVEERLRGLGYIE
jgi:metal-responsive CopG/Arc/MetJ family transcriptional regulator